MQPFEFFKSRQRKQQAIEDSRVLDISNTITCQFIEEIVEGKELPRAFDLDELPTSYKYENLLVRVANRVGEYLTHSEVTCETARDTLIEPVLSDEYTGVIWRRADS